MGILISLFYSIIFAGMASSMAHYPSGNSILFYGLVGAVVLNSIYAAISFYHKQSVTAVLQVSVAILFGSIFLHINNSDADVPVFLAGSVGCSAYLFVKLKRERTVLAKLTLLNLVFALVVLVLMKIGLGIPSTVAITVCCILAISVVYSIYIKNKAPKNGMASNLKAKGGNLVALLCIVMLMISAEIIPGLYSPNPNPDKATLSGMDREEKEALEAEIEQVHELAKAIIEK